MGSTVVAEKTEEELRKEIDELYRQQREITELLRDPRGIRRGGLSSSGPLNFAGNGGRHRGFVRPAERIDGEDQPPAKRRLSSAVVKLEVGEIAEDGSEGMKDMKKEDLAVDFEENANANYGDIKPSHWSQRDGNKRPSKMNFEIPPAEHVPRVLPKDEDPCLVSRINRTLLQILGPLEMTGRRRDKGKQVASKGDRVPPRLLVDEDETQLPFSASQAHLSLPLELFATGLGGLSGATEAHTSGTHVSADRPVERLFIFPRGRKFSAPTVCARRIGKIIEEKFTGPWKSWKSVPAKHRDFMFNKFKLYFWWTEKSRDDIRRIFETVGSNVLKNRLYDAKTANKRPPWISKVVWGALLLQWNVQDYRTLCERNRRNRASDCGGLGFPLHVGGSITHLTHMDKMEKYGRDPTVSELFLKNYSRLNSKGEREWNDARSEPTHVSYVETHGHSGDDDASSEALPPLQTQIERWVEMEGGKKKSRVYGLAGLKDKLSGSSSSRGPTQREQQLEIELSTVRDELTQLKEQVSSLQQSNDAKTVALEEIRAQMATFEQMRPQMAAFEEMRVQMATFMRMTQPNQGSSASFPFYNASLPFSSIVAPMPRGTFTAPIPFGPSHVLFDDNRTDSDVE